MPLTATRNVFNDRELKAKRNMVKMIIFTSLFFTVGNLPHGISFFIRFYFGAGFKFETILVLFANTMLFASHGFNVFLYYFFDIKYKKTFKSAFQIKIK